MVNGWTQDKIDGVRQSGQRLARWMAVLWEA